MNQTRDEADVCDMASGDDADVCDVEADVCDMAADVCGKASSPPTIRREMKQMCVTWHQTRDEADVCDMASDER